MINWGRGSGSAFTVGVRGQMSLALSASPDALLAFHPRLFSKDEVVTQSNAIEAEERRER